MGHGRASPSLRSRLRSSLTLPTLLRWEARLLKQQQEVSAGDDTSPGGQGVPLEEIQEQEEC